MRGMAERIAKITSTMLGYEDHGILTCMLQVDYGGSAQGIGGYAFDQFDRERNRRVGHGSGIDFMAGVLGACGVQTWEEVRGRTILVYTAGDDYQAQVTGIGPLPTEPGKIFLFDSIKPSQP